MTGSLRILSMLLALLAISACSNRAIYENLRLQQRTACLKEPPSLYEACMEGARQPYDDYRREREEMLQDSKR